MKKSFWKVKCLFLLVLPLITACSPEFLDWTEEVRLHDGKIIQVKRREELALSGFPVDKRGGPLYYQFCYTPMGIHWKSKPGYFPETFDIVDGKAYVKVSIHGPEQCMLNDYPETDAIYFVWNGDSWRKISHSDFPKGLRYNMHSGSITSDPKHDPRGFISLAEKELLDDMYFFMKKDPAITGLNEVPGYPGECRRVRNVIVNTTSTADIFLPADRKDCL